MTSTVINCGKCNKPLPNYLRVVNCDTCKKFYHVKCCRITHKTFNTIKRSNDRWHCETCLILVSNTNTQLNATCPTEDDGNASKSN